MRLKPRLTNFKDSFYINEKTAPANETVTTSLMQMKVCRYINSSMQCNIYTFSGLFIRGRGFIYGSGFFIKIKNTFGSNLVPQFCKWRCITVFPGRSKQHDLSCLLLYWPGNTVTDRPLANLMVPIKASKNGN